MAGVSQIIGMPRHSQSASTTYTSPAEATSNASISKSDGEGSLKLKGTKDNRHVSWTSETVDNEHLNKKKSKSIVTI